jgi:ABC-type branched-subunit amino acid transport system substrate-binding protein
MRVAFRNSARDARAALQGAIMLTSSFFGQRHVSAIVGAASSGASLSVAQVASVTAVPQISYSSTSHMLSDAQQYPYFLRTVPSDAFQAEALVDLLTSYFGHSAVALVTSDDAYGVGGHTMFLGQATRHALQLLITLKLVHEEDTGTWTLAHPAADQTGANNATGAQPAAFAALRATRARVIVLFCPASAASQFLVSAYEAGIGGDGYLIVGSDAVTNLRTYSSHPALATNHSLREAILRGYCTSTARQLLARAYGVGLRAGGLLCARPRS